MVFIPQNYNDLSRIRDNILCQTISDVELIFVENNLDSFMGQFHAFNETFQKAKGKTILLMDAYTDMSINCLEKLWTFLKANPDVLAVSSDCILKSSNTYYSVPHSHREIELSLLKEYAFKYSVFLIRSDVFRKLNRFDELYFSCFRYELICRLVCLGSVASLPEALSYHVCTEGINLEETQEEYVKVQRIYQRNFINSHLTLAQEVVTENEINASNLGLVISYYTYAAYSGKDKYNKMADLWLDEILSELTDTMPVKLRDGVLGIACGVVYMIRNKFIEGNEDEILFEIDQMLYRKLFGLDDETRVTWYDWFYFSRKRLSFSTLQERGLPGILFQQNFIYMLDCLLRGLQKKISLSDNILSELEWVHSRKICPVTTQRIIDLIRKENRIERISLPQINEKKTAFLIPLRIDSKERERNLDMLLTELSSFDNAEIWILEADKYPNYCLKADIPNVNYIFRVDSDPIFHRTKYLNLLLNKTTCSIVGIWDTDVFICKKQIEDAIENIRLGDAVMSFPYDGRFLMLSPEQSEDFVKTRSMSFLVKNLDLYHLVHGFHSVGGAFFVNRSVYLQAGGENEEFYGWGPEDAERVKRMEILGMPFYRSEGPLFHLFHPRKKNSWFANRAIELKNRMEFLNVCGKTCNELTEYIKLFKN